MNGIMLSEPKSFIRSRRSEVEFFKVLLLLSPFDDVQLPCHCVFIISGDDLLTTRPDMDRLTTQFHWNVQVSTRNCGGERKSEI